MCGVGGFHPSAMFVSLCGILEAKKPEMTCWKQCLQQAPLPVLSLPPRGFRAKFLDLGAWNRLATHCQGKPPARYCRASLPGRALIVVHLNLLKNYFIWQNESSQWIEIGTKIKALCKQYNTFVTVRWTDDSVLSVKNRNQPLTRILQCLASGSETKQCQKSYWTRLNWNEYKKHFDMT